MLILCNINSLTPICYIIFFYFTYKIYRQCLIGNWVFYILELNLSNSTTMLLSNLTKLDRTQGIEESNRWNSRSEFPKLTTTRYSQEMENIRGEIAALRTQTSMAMVRSQSQPLIKDSELPALSNPSRVKKLTKFFGTEPPLIRLFLRELGYEVCNSNYLQSKSLIYLFVRENIH